MFQKLQQKWGVNHRQFWIIFIVFGLTGTTTAILTRYVTAWLGMDASSFWVWKLMVRLGMLVFGYQFILLGYGALLGQWAFFWKYEELLLRKYYEKSGRVHRNTEDAGGWRIVTHKRRRNQRRALSRYLEHQEDDQPSANTDEANPDGEDE